MQQTLYFRLSQLFSHINLMTTLYHFNEITIKQNDVIVDVCIPVLHSKVSTMWPTDLDGNVQGFFAYQHKGCLQSFLIR